MASLKATYSSESNIPEGLAGFYKQQADGSYKINLEDGVKTQADIDRVEAALEKERDLRVDTQKELDKYKDVDLERWKKLKDYDPEKKPTGAENKTEEEIRKELSQEYRDKERELEEQFEQKEQDLEDKIKEARQKAKNTIRENWMRRMLAEKYGFTDPRRLNALMLEIKHGNDPDLSQIRKDFETVEAVEDGDTYKVVGGSLKDEQGAFEALEKVSSTEVAKHYKPASDNSGGGANNNGAADTGGKKLELFDKEKGNRTERGKFIKESPDEARKLAKQAGWKDHEINW